MFMNEALLDIGMWTYLSAESFFDVTRIMVIVALVGLSIVCLYLTKLNIDGRIRVGSLYAHLVFLALIPAYLLYICNCPLSLAICPYRLIGYAAIPTFIGFFLLGLYILPWTFSRFGCDKVVNREILGFVKKQAAKLVIGEPPIYLVNDNKPEAYAFTHLWPKVFITNGMFRLLTKKEIEAVILHELAHIKKKSSLFQFSMFFVSSISPIARFGLASGKDDVEEIEADEVVVKIQRTGRYLESAKRKLEKFCK